MNVVKLGGCRKGVTQSYELWGNLVAELKKLMNEGKSQFGVKVKMMKTNQLKLPSFKTKMAFEYRVSKDLKYLAQITGSALILTDIKTGKEVIQFKDLKYPSSIAFANNSRTIALKTTSGKFGVYDLGELKLTKTFSPTKQEGCNFFYSPDDRYLIDADWNGNIILIDLANDKTEIIKHYQNYMVENIDARDGKYIFLISPKANPDTGRIDRDLILLEWKYPFDKNKSVEIRLPHNWQRIAKYSHKSDLLAMDERNELVIFNIQAGKTFRRLKLAEDIKDLAWSVDDEYLGVVSGNRVQLYNFEEFSLKKEIEMEYACFIDFPYCGSYILISSWNKGYYLTMDDFIKW